ncbi:MAG: hypothetical protein QOE35_3599 [Actinomycetota bacterium]
MAVVTIAPEASSPSWARKFPPLIAIVVALLIALAVLPSALNLPQSNPSTVLEYAPVPPTDDTPPQDNNSNLSSLSLSGSSGVQGGGALGGVGGADGLPDSPADNSRPNARTSRTKRCVPNKDGTARQTEDPLAPPCVASFDGDNFGSTYQGVSRDEITLLIYEDGAAGQLATSKGAQEVAPDPGTYKDLDDPPTDNDFIHERTARVWLKYFNDRFQTYGRRVHGYIYYSGAESDEGRRADASDNASGKSMPKPFAVIDQANFRGHNAAYQDGMARRGVLIFEDLNGLANSFYKKYAPLVWGFWPDIERQADQYVSYVCDRVVKSGTVTHSGPQYLGQKRKYGMIYTSDKGYPGLQLLAQYVQQGVEACGAKIADTATFPVAGYSVSAGQSPDYAALGMSKFQSEGINTILWAGGQETFFSHAAGNLNYLPEWIIAGDRVMESFFNAGQQDQNVWNHAWAVSNVTCHGKFDDEPDVRAFREASGPDFPRRDIQYAQPVYLDMFQLFRAIQVAGPRLGPSSVDKGFHAIPRIKSDNCQKPAGFYDSGDYSYVKDASVMVWDSNADNPFSSQQPKGCYRMLENSARYLAGQWGEGDDFASGRYKGTEPCNAYDVSIGIRTGPAPSS